MADKKLESGNQFVIDTRYDRYKEFFPLLTRDVVEDYSSRTTSHGASQYPIWHDPEQSIFLSDPKKYGADFEIDPYWDTIAEGIYTWTKRKLAQHKINVEIKPVISWYMDYRKGGWQSVHTHSKNCITQVIQLDEQTHSFKAEENKPIELDLKEAQWGSTYTILTGEEPIYGSFMNYPGRCILMSGDVFHGVYPVKSVPRRCIVIDYIILT